VLMAPREVTASHRHVSFPELRGVAPFTRRSGGRRPNPAGAQFAAAPVVKRLLVSAAVLIGLLTLVPATAIQVPSALRIGNQSLPAASCATRDTLWIHHYAAALYVPPKTKPDAALQDPKQPKALHVQILSKTFLPKEMPKKWRQTLEQQLDGPSLNSIRNAWRDINVGDRVTIMYAPGPGVTLQLNERVVARSPKHDLVDALLRTWAENEPVPQRLSRTVAKHPC
jgi:hypothetical protein